MKSWKTGIAIIASALALSVAVSGCSNSPTKQDVGSLLGAGVGILAGSAIGGGTGRTIAMIIGGIGGYVIGGNIGRELDRADQERLAGLAYQGLNNQQPGVVYDSWRDSRGRQIESHVYTQPRYEAQGKTCRRVRQETVVYIDGRPERAVKDDVACYDPWQRIWVIQ